MEGDWENRVVLPSRQYVCGYCGNPLASQLGYQATCVSVTTASIYICHFCQGPTSFFEGRQFPGPLPGMSVEHVPQLVRALYDEARACCQVGANTASVLCSRKLLMNIAVSKGAEVGLQFAKYVDYLAEKGYLPPDGKEWVDHIRKRGNEATHDIVIMGATDAKELIAFLEMLLRFIYEFPGRVKSNLATTSAAT